MRLLMILPVLLIPFLGMNANKTFSEIKTVDILFSPDTIMLPKADSAYPVKILIPGTFKKDEINYDANTMDWYALLGDGVKFFIRKISPEMTATDFDSGEKGWIIKGHDSLNTILMFSGVEMVDKEVYEMKVGHKTFNPGDRLEMNYNGKKYVITADGKEMKNKQKKTKYIGNYKMSIAPLKKEKKAYLISYQKALDDSQPTIIFMGDMDGDKKPDLIVNNANSKKENHYTLYLSNNPPKGYLYKVMGIFNFTTQDQ